MTAPDATPPPALTPLHESRVRGLLVDVTLDDADRACLAAFVDAYDAQAARLAAMDEVAATTLRWHAAIAQRNAVETRGGPELQAALEELLSAYQASVAATARYRGMAATDAPGEG